MGTPKEFGRGTWVYLFFLSLLSFNDIELNKLLINQIINSIPCPKCKFKTLNYFNEISFDKLSNRYEIIKHLLILRNDFYPKINIEKYGDDFLLSDIKKNDFIYRIANGLGK